MELFDLLETRVVELLGQIDTLREENKTLQEKVNALDDSRVYGRSVTDRYPYAQLSAQCPRHGHFLPYGC